MTAPAAPLTAVDHARLGLEAHARYFGATGNTPGRKADHDAAISHLSAALRLLDAANPLRFEVSFALGVTRIHDHKTVCAKPCPATAEFPEIVALLAIAGGREHAPVRELHLYAIAVDKLYDHTHKSSDIELALVWLRRVADHPRLAVEDRRRMLICLAIQYANRAQALHEADSDAGTSRAVHDSFAAAIEQFEAVIAELDRGRGRDDATRDEDRLDALLGLLETYDQRAAGQWSDAELDTMIRVGRRLYAAMTPDYRLRWYALGRFGNLLAAQISRRLGDSWDSALNVYFTQLRPDAYSESLFRSPALLADVDTAVDALAQSVRFTDPAEPRWPLLVSALCMVLVLRLASRDDDQDARELGRLCRIVMERPDAAPEYRRQCAECLALSIVHRLRKLGVNLELAPDALSTASLPTTDADLDTLISLLGRFLADDGAETTPTLAAIYAAVVAGKARGELTQSESATLYRHQREMAAATVRFPATHAVMLYVYASTGAAWVQRGTAPTAVVEEVAAAYQQAIANLPSGHPIARYLASEAASFTARARRPRPRPTPANRIPKTIAYRMPAASGAFDLRTTALLGGGSHRRLAAPAGRVIEVVEPLLSTPPQDGIVHAALHCTMALALHNRWLREREGSQLTTAIDHLDAATRLAPEQQPLHDRINELLASMLADRCQINGDHADADAAVNVLDELLQRADSARSLPDLNALLAAALDNAASRHVAPLLAAPPDGRRPAHRVEVEAALGSALLLAASLDGSAASLSRAVTLLERAAKAVPDDSLLRLPVLSDLGTARLLRAASQDTIYKSEPAIRAVLTAASQCPADHPHRPAMLLRAGGALTGYGRSDYNASLVDEGIELLSDALRTAGLRFLGERARCLYGLGHALLIRHAHAGASADLECAIEVLEEARTLLDTAPGDPFMVPLLRSLAAANRMAGANEPGLRRRQSLSIGKSLLHAHASAVLLQSGPEQGLAVARHVSDDTLRLTDWCLVDGRPKAAVEALELGRGLVLHAATVAADVAGLLRAAGRENLAEEWNTHANRTLTASRDAASRVPSDLRHRVLTALAGSAAETRLLTAPRTSDIATALRLVRMDALVYLIPADADGADDEGTGGRALIVHARGAVEECPLPDLTIAPGSPVSRYAAAQRDLITAMATVAPDVEAATRRRDRTLADLCSWAWIAVVGPLLDQLRAARPDTGEPIRLVLAPVGVLGIVPWHAAKRPAEPAATATASDGFRYACEDAVFSACASARQLVEAAARDRVGRNGRKVLVANPNRDREMRWGMYEADALRQAYYPETVYLGYSRSGPVQGDGTPQEVLAELPGRASHEQAALLHFGCHARAGGSPAQSHLVLAAEQKLPIAEILARAADRPAGSPGGLIVLASCVSDLALSEHDEALTLASAFLTTGATSVVGSRWPVPSMKTALLMFMFHRHLVRHPNDSPADALRAAQLWMLDPERRPPSEMPGLFADEARRPDLADPYAWAAFTHHGQ